MSSEEKESGRQKSVRNCFAVPLACQRGLHLESTSVQPHILAVVLLLSRAGYGLHMRGVILHLVPEVITALGFFESSSQSYTSAHQL